MIKVKSVRSSMSTNTAITKNKTSIETQILVDKPKTTNDIHIAENYKKKNEKCGDKHTFENEFET